MVKGQGIGKVTEDFLDEEFAKEAIFIFEKPLPGSHRHDIYDLFC